MTRGLRHFAMTFSLVAASLGIVSSALTAQVPPPPPPPGPQSLPAGASLTAEVPAQLSWIPGEGIPLSVATKLAEAPRITAVIGPFVDSSRMKALQTDFCLSSTPTGPCTDRPTVAANELQQLWVVAKGKVAAEPGTYAGNVRLVAGNGLQVSVPLALNVTSDRWQLIGLLALAAGVVLSFIMSVWLPQQRARDLALMPFLHMQQRLGAARALLEATDVETIARADALAKELQPASLRSHNLIPSIWPAATATPAGPDLVKAHMEARLAAIELLAAAMKRSTAAQRTVLDGLAADLAFPQPDLQAQVSRALGIAPGRGAPPGAAATPATLVFHEEVRNFAFWVLSSILAVAVGYVLLVDGDPSFGGWKDVTSALLWGLGVATAGTKAADLTVGQLRAAI